MSDLSKYKQLYLSEAEEKLASLNSALLDMEKEPDNVSIAERAMRASHTLKSSSAAMGYTNISELLHIMEDFFEQTQSEQKKLSAGTIQLLFDCTDALITALQSIKKGGGEPSTASLIQKLQDSETPETLIHKNTIAQPVKEKGTPASSILEPPTSIKVDVTTLDSLMTLTEELLVEKMRLEQVTKNASPDIENVVKNINRLMSDLQYTVTQTHMVPLGQLFERFPRVVRDLAKDQGKEVTFDVSGQDIELGRTVIDRIGEPLIHLLRNAVDHGTQQNGVVSIEAIRTRDSVEISVSNTGRPIDWKRVVESAVKREIIDTQKGNEYKLQIDKVKIPTENLTPEICNLLYHPQLSTKETVTTTSGRGIGLAIVKTAIEALGGHVNVTSTADRTRFTLSIPLTIAIIQALLVRVSGQVYALPFSQVDRLARIPFSRIKKALDREVAVVHGEDIPLLRLEQIFQLTGHSSIFLTNEQMKETKRQMRAELIVITKPGKTASTTSGRIGLVVDDVFSEQDIVVKPMQGVLRHSKGFAGITLLGDGQPALILDVATLV